MIQTLDPRHYSNISRYKRNRQLYDNETDKIYLESTNQYNIDVGNSPIYHVVDTLEEGRLDKIALAYYGDASFYWAIALANNIIDPFIVKANTILVIPYIEDLFNNNGPLSIMN
jgi:hypothetical protein